MNRKNLHIMLGALLFGIVMWLSVTLREQYQATVNVPLEIENVPQGWAVKTAVPREIALRLRGDGWRLALLLLGRDLKLRFPLSSIPSGLRFSDAGESGKTRVITIDDVADRLTLRGNLRLIDIKPDSIYVALDRYAEKKVPVVLDCAASFHDGYGQVGSPVVSPDSVLVGGAVSVLKEIDRWHTTSTTFDDVRAPVDEDIPLAQGTTYELSFSTSAVHVRINVQPFAEKLFSALPVTVTGAPEDREVIFIPPRIDIVARAGIRQLAILNDQDFLVSVSYAAILADSTGTIEYTADPPRGVQVVSKRPERLQYIVRKRLYETVR